ncbi:caspase family protein [Falsiroseomonas stagni]|uniref:Caspase domain-containing protein n=1 Tax=Falsiroseomonas stagni DSM 19981 TaxID=1123062 RepID=A0A1I4FFA0_9PROT|nr:caspase family protein [Falsiroseomonas stagni]SFL16139.1 Caspase domain-containing protein [Falsiroseomonas stagni DSM 19981]
MHGPTRRALAAAALGLPSMPARAQALPRLFALLVGIDTYPFIRALRGCVNDARAIETAVRPIVTRMTVLLDAEATRGTFLRTWDAMAAEARPGDTLLITFSGHGGQEPERRRGNEADGRDETLIFHAFSPRRQPNNAERIIDDELGERFARSGARGVRSIFLADSCHAGTLTRSMDRRIEALGDRSAGMQQIENDMLAGLDMPAAEAAGQPNLLFIAAGQENQLVPEMMIDGRPHGATSFSFAQAITRAVAAGGFPTSDAFAREVVAATRARADGRHHPLAENRLPPDQPLIRLSGRTAHVTTVPPSAALRLYVLPGGGALAAAAAALPGVQITADRATADAVLDAVRAELVSGLGDVVAAQLDPGALAGAVEKLAALRLVQARGLPAMEIGLVPRGVPLAPGGANSRDERHAPGAEFDLVLRPPPGCALVVVALAAEGTVRVLSTPKSSSAPQREFRRGVRVTPLSGVAHAVGLAVGGSAAEVQALLNTLDRSRAPLQVVRALLSTNRPQAFALLGFHVA